MSRTALRRAAGPAVALVTVALTVLPALPSGAAATPGPATRSVTLLLSSPAPSALDALAGTRALTPTQRRAALAAVEPTADQHQVVASDLAARGLRVVGSTAWSVTATGTTGAVDDLAGSLATRRADDPVGAGPAGAAPAAAVPHGDLGSLVSAVVGGDDTAPVVHPLSALTGSDFRTLYSASGSGPQVGKSRLTVATLQFSGWDSSSLTEYAASQSIADPVASGAYVGVRVDGASTSRVDGTGDIEVALDQESLLSTAPQADQRAYFAPNSVQGFVDGIERVASDAAAHRIAALSISWGDCEQHWGKANIAAVHTALQHALAAGVTVLASSGDSGAAACAASSPLQTSDAVTYPASDPYVVSVGGTRVTSIASHTETAWSGSGGGRSVAFARPRFQHNVVSSTKARLVPDLAADADPSTGFTIAVRGTTAQVGGTSLSAPVSAALLADTLEARGHEQGVGNVLARLYDAPSSAFRDITSGNNGHQARIGYDEVTGRGSALWNVLGPSLDSAPTVTTAAYSKTRTVPLAVHVPAGVTYTAWRAGTGARPGSCAGLTTGALPASVHTSHDGSAQVWVQGRTSTSACFSATTVVTVDTVRPKATASLALSSHTSPSHVTADWTSTDAHGSGASSATVTVMQVGAVVPLATHHGASSHGSWRVPSRQGQTYRVQVVVTDRAGNVSRPATARAAVPIDDARFDRHGTWTRHAAHAAFAHAYRSSDAAGATANVEVTGSRFTLLVSTCSTCGLAAVYLDGHRVRTVDLSSRGTHYRVHVAVGERTLGSHRVTVRVLGRYGSTGRGTTVRVDGLVAVR